MYLKSVTINNDFPIRVKFPFNIPAFQKTESLEFNKPVVFFVGENGSGKSALMDAIARKSGFLPWGGSKTHRVHDNQYETQLANYLTLKFDPRHRYGFHFRAEAFFNFAASLDDMILDDPARREYFGGSSLNTLSHGESFLSFFRGYSFQLNGLYLLDEPEAALSPRNQLRFVQMIRENVKSAKKQYIIATHSPIILGCPNSQIFAFDDPPIREIPFTKTGSYLFYKEFLDNPEDFLNR